MTPWMEELVARLQETFGARLRFVGLQGSRARGETGPESDIDAVVILDAVSIQDIRAYRALLETCLLYTSFPHPTVSEIIRETIWEFKD